MTFVERYLNRHILFEVAPGIVFLGANLLWGLKWATAALIAATIVFTLLSIGRGQRAPVFPVIAIVLVLALGGASLIFEQAQFINMKPTIGKCLFAAALVAGLQLRPCLLARALEGQVYLTDAGWRVLTLRWALFALGLAGVNELVWRTQGTDAWVTFTACLTPASILGYILITRHTAPRFWEEPANE